MAQAMAAAMLIGQDGNAERERATTRMTTRGRTAGELKERPLTCHVEPSPGLPCRPNITATPIDSPHSLRVGAEALPRSHRGYKLPETTDRKFKRQSVEPFRVAEWMRHPTYLSRGKSPM